MFACGTYEYGLKTGDLPEKEMVKIFEKALSKIAGEINDSRIPKKRKLKKMTGPFGGRVIEELFRTLPGEKVFIKKYAPGENRL
ncbi:hypothetical protein C823_002960 [Eubacterium plexicaudatum ASF492]|uniref:Uncharacterized protein n=1 Tax=Eubacterium plexicaudatum ASF492 TaxID=1235802 RepID=N2AS26_9FIRM|nr:hypothetical protein C823_002960 [Eubacterium plexicaudatum ASF492]